MGDMVWIQCQTCGHLYKIRNNKTSAQDDLYIEVFCPKCRDETQHLICGEDETEISYYYNANLDPRYYDYNTK